MSNSIVPSVDENLLWVRLCKGDREAFTGIYTLYFPILFEYCIRFTADRNLVKDILQDFFTGLLREKSNDLSPVHSLKSYLLVSVRRRLVRGLAQPKEDTDLPFHLELSPEAILIRREENELVSRQLQERISALSTRQREAVYLYFYENLPYEEVAAIMGMKEVKYARTLVYRALEALRLSLKEEGGNIFKKVQFG